MTWDYEEVPAIDQKYQFSGPYYTTRRVKEELKDDDINLAFNLVQWATYAHDGLDRIQRLKHSIHGKIVWIVDDLSEEQKKQIMTHSTDVFESIRESTGTVMMFPDEY